MRAPRTHTHTRTQRQSGREGKRKREFHRFVVFFLVFRFFRNLSVSHNRVTGAGHRIMCVGYDPGIHECSTTDTTTYGRRMWCVSVVLSSSVRHWPQFSPTASTWNIAQIVLAAKNSRRGKHQTLTHLHFYLSRYKLFEAIFSD